MSLYGSAVAQEEQTEADTTQSAAKQHAEIQEEADVDDERLIDFSLAANAGATFNSIDQSEEEKTENVQWVSSLRSSFALNGEPFQFLSSVFAQYGQLHEEGVLPQKTKDNLIVTVMPSISLFPAVGIRLFFETTGETTMGKGDIDEVPTKFLDPLFLYQTLFLGRRHHNDEGFNLIYGIGYALQQTIAKEFVLEENRDFVIDQNNPLTSVQDQVNLESGYSAILQVDYATPIAGDLEFSTNFKTVALTKAPVIEDFADSRVSSLLLAGLQFNVLSIDYTLKMTYDRNYSLRRQLDQGLVVGLKFSM